MNPIFKKLNFKTQAEVLVLDAPESFQVHLEEMQDLTSFVFALENVEQIHFVLAFVTQQSQIEQLVPQIAPKLEGDALVWLAYPKKSSKNYHCDFDRDTGWDILGKYNLEPVRMVAIDADWSALRFRKVEFIKKITRRESMALTEEAKKRTSQQGK